MKNFRTAAMAAFILMIAGGMALSAQGLKGSGGTSAKTYQLTVALNLPNMVVIVDNVQIRGTTANVTAGQHVVKITADGYYDVVENINVQSNYTLKPLMRTKGHQVTFNAGVPGAVVYVDGVRIEGLLTFILPGNHTVKITAPGYEDYVSTVNITAPFRVNAKLNPLGHLVTINAGVPGAVIYVDGVIISGNSITVTPGRHTIRITAQGYQEYQDNLNVLRPIVLAPELRQAGYQVVINTNVRNPDIYVDNAAVRGNVVLLLPGNHSLRITAEGYQDYFTTLKVAGPMTFNAQLAVAGFPLTVNANVRGATVSVNNVAKGNVPYTEYLPPGTYMVVVSAPGYLSYAASVPLSAPMTVNADLTYNGPASVTFVIPREFQTRDAWGQVKFYIDGKPVTFKGNWVVSVEPGRHEIEVSSGGFIVKSANMDFQAGAAYTIELFMELRMEAVKNGR